MDLRNPGQSWRPTCSWCWAQTTPTAPPTSCGWSPRHRTSCWRSPPAAPAARTRSASARCTAPWAYGSTGNSTRRTTTWSRRCRGWSSSKASIGRCRRWRAQSSDWNCGSPNAGYAFTIRRPGRTCRTLAKSTPRGSAPSRSARSGVTPCAGSRSPSAGGSSPTGRGAGGGARGPAAPDPRQRFQRRPLTSVRDHFRNRLTALETARHYTDVGRSAPWEGPFRAGRAAGALTRQDGAVICRYPFL